MCNPMCLGDVISKNLRKTENPGNPHGTVSRCNGKAVGVVAKRNRRFVGLNELSNILSL